MEGSSPGWQVPGSLLTISRGPRSPSRPPLNTREGLEPAGRLRGWPSSPEPTRASRSEPAGAFPRSTERSKVVSLPFWRCEAGAETLLLPVGGVRWSRCDLRGHARQEGQQTRPAHLAGRSLWPGEEPGEAGAADVTDSPSSSHSLDGELAPSPRKTRRRKGRTGEQEVRGRLQLCHLLVQRKLWNVLVPTDPQPCLAPLTCTPGETRTSEERTHQTE